jgi:hypothetical protein
MKPTTKEIDETVSRMEARYAGSPQPEVNRLMAHYRGLLKRFESDLSDRRDLALSKAAVLMLIQSVAQASEPKTSD